MTSKLKCPFCGQKLLREYNRGRDTVIYRCDNCYFQGDGIIWQALIQAKQDLEIARKALKLYCGKDVWYCWDSKIDATQAEEALEQIEHKE